MEIDWSNTIRKVTRGSVEQLLYDYYYMYIEMFAYSEYCIQWIVAVLFWTR